MNENKRAEKRNKIVDTAISLFQKNSVGATAVDDIVKAAGIARGTFYLYFKDKSDLLEQIIMMKSRDAMREMLTESLERFDSDNMDFIGFAEIFINCFIDFLGKNKATIIIIQKNMSVALKSAPTFGDEQMAEIFSRIMKEMETYGYTPDTALKTIHIVVDMIDTVCSDAILSAGPFGLDEIKDSVVTAALNILKYGKDNQKGSDNQ